MWKEISDEILFWLYIFSPFIAWLFVGLILAILAAIFG